MSKSSNTDAKAWSVPLFPGLTALHGTFRDLHFAPHFHEEYAVGVIQAGGQRGRIGPDRDVFMPKGCIVAINPGEVHTGGPADERGWTYRMLYLPAGLVRDIATRQLELRDLLPEFPRPVFFDPPLVDRLVVSHQALESADAHGLAREVMLLEAIGGLLLRHGKSTQGARGGPPRGAAGVQAARDYIEQQFAEDVRLETLAGLAKMSPFHFLRLFRRVVGLPPHAFLTLTRLHNAARQLRDGMPISLVAAETGFADQSHLTRCFKRVFGVTPGRFS
jgi:AraC-like DNA-binding protein